MKVTFTRQPRTYINNFNFFTETDQDQTDVNLDKNAKDATSGDPQKAINAFKDMMSKFGNSLTEMFKKLMDWIKGLPELASKILGRLKGLWGKIKSWLSRSPIIDKAKSLSIITVHCVGFAAGLVASWIYYIFIRIGIHGRATFRRTKYHELKARRYIKRFKNPKKYMPNAKTSQEKKSIDETAVFIETFGEILREDTNGGAFMAMSKKAITAGIDKVDKLYKAFRNAKNKTLRCLVNYLTTAIHGSNATLTKA